MKAIRRISKKYYLRQIVACWTICAMLLAFAPARVAMAKPSNPVLKYGNATFTELPNGFEVNVNGMKHIIHWNSLNTDWNQFLRFYGPSGAAVLNRVMNNLMTQFNGELTAAGMKIYIINPAGVVFGAGARINVAQLIASNLDISDSDFLADNLVFGKLTENYAIENYAGKVIFNAHAGDVAADRIYLISGKEVWNKGGLVANDCVVLAAGDSVIISETGSSVAVVADMGGGNPADFIVKNMDQMYDGVATKIEAEHVAMAAGDIWSSAFVGAYSDGGSDAVATIDVVGAGNVAITNNMTAEAISNGVDNAIATIDVTAGGNLTIQSGGSSGTEISALAEDGLNNTAEVSLTAGGAFTIDAPDQVTVTAEADSDCFAGNLNQANVNIKGSSVKITGTDLGSTDEPATVKAYAHDAMVNRAGVDIEATECDVEIIGAGSNGDSALVLALAKNGLENYANVGIKAAGDVDIIAKKGQPTTGDDATKAVVLAKAENTCEPGLINEAGVDITAGGDVTVMSEGGALYYEIYVYNHYQGWHWEAVTEIPGWYEGETRAYFTPYEAKVLAIARNAVTNTATVGINAGGDVKVIAKDGGIAKVMAITDGYGEENTSSVDITAGGDVKVLALDGETEEWQTLNTPENWDVQYKQKVIDTPENWDVKIKQWVLETPEYWTWQFRKWRGYYYEYKTMTTSTDNMPYAGSGWSYVSGSKTHYDATYHWEYDWMYGQSTPWPSLSGDWEYAWDWVHHDATWHYNYMWLYGQSSEYPGKPSGWDYAHNSVFHPATYNYHSDFNPSEALIMAKAENAEENTATVGIDAVGGDVVVLGKDGGQAGITALAKDAESLSTNNAKVKITATKVDVTEMVEVEEGVFEEVVVGTRGGDVKVIAKCEGEPSKAEIEALAIGDWTTNNADVLICIDGGVKVKGEDGGKAEIEALAKGCDSINTATVGIGAKGTEGVQVIADRGGEAGISSKAKNGTDNTASTIVCTQGGVLVKATRGGDAEILAQAKTGINNDAYVGVCAVDSVVVQTGETYPDQVEGCDAVIRAEADMGYIQLKDLPLEADPIITTTKAETVVVSHQGNVEVLAYNHGRSGIEAEAEGAHLNTAKVGVAAGADLSPEDVIVLPPEIPDGEVVYAASFDGPMYSTGNVIVEARHGSEAQIYAYAHDAMPTYEYPSTETSEGQEPIMIPGENTASVVICAPGEVRVEADRCSEARIKSRAGENGEDYSINKAKTQVYASEVKVDVASLRHGQGIWAYAEGVGNAHVGSEYCLTQDGLVAEIVTNENGSAELIINDYSQRTDCPTCPPCPCEEPGVLPVTAAEPAADVPAPVAPLPPYFIPRIEGCPQLTQAAAAELGIPDETLQVGLGNALALNPNLQPCGACASLLNAASILKDVDGARMAAMMQVFNATAPADAPFTPEMATSIAMAFEGAAEGSQYASAMEFVDAFVQYAAALDSLGSPVGDSTAFVMGKYGEGLGQNSNMADFVAGRIASGQTF